MVKNIPYYYVTTPFCYGLKAPGVGFLSYLLTDSGAHDQRGGSVTGLANPVLLSTFSTPLLPFGAYAMRTFQSTIQRGARLFSTQDYTR